MLYRMPPKILPQRVVDRRFVCKRRSNVLGQSYYPQPLPVSFRVFSAFYPAQ